jgi:hypothetical protein
MLARAHGRWSGVRYGREVASVGWDNDAWQQIGDYEVVWTPFNARFHFRPGMDPEKWPAIEEPAGSVTLDLSPIFARDDRGFSADEAAVNDFVLDAFTETFPSDCRLIALDWQHPAYWFWPHRQTTLDEAWRVPAFPNRDYFVLMTEDMSQGTFGHPWEQTLCVFGRDLVETLVPRLSEAPDQTHQPVLGLAVRPLMPPSARSPTMPR